MIDRKHRLAISQQEKMLGVSRGSVYYQPRSIADNEFALMRKTDQLHQEFPFMDARMLRDQLVREGKTVGRTHVSTLMIRMGIEAVYQKPKTSKKHPGHAIYPYLLGGMNIDRANQVWFMDTTYIPMAKGFVYLTVVVDWVSRKVLAAKVAISLEACHAVDVLNEAFAHHGTPEVISTDKGSQFTAAEFVKALKSRGCQLSMDGRGAWRDIFFVERLWRTVKYEQLYLHAYDSVPEFRFLAATRHMVAIRAMIKIWAATIAGMACRGMRSNLFNPMYLQGKASRHTGRACPGPRSGSRYPVFYVWIPERVRNDRRHCHPLL